MDEASFTAARTVADLERPRLAAPATEPELRYPSWTGSWWARAVRGAVQFLVARPLTRYFARIRVSGLENLEGLQPPVIFAPNHQSIMDVPAILCALPRRWRNRVAPAMSKEWFQGYFYPERYSGLVGFGSRIEYCSAVLFYNAFPLPQRNIGARGALRYMGSLLDQGWCVLIFPEGDRTYAGEIHPFRPGAAMLASHVHAPVVPVRLEGMEKVLNRDARWPSHERVRVSFGAPLRIEGNDYAAAAKKLEDAVRGLA